MINLSNNSFRIEIADQQSLTHDGEALTQAVSMILEDYGLRSAEISIALVDDPSMRVLNQKYLNHDYETDVLSFLLDSTEDTLSGQLIISTDTAERVGAELGIPMQHELLLYAIHGTLHLVGLDDTEPELAVEMRAAEREYLERMGVRLPSSEEENG